MCVLQQLQSKLRELIDNVRVAAHMPLATTATKSAITNSVVLMENAVRKCLKYRFGIAKTDHILLVFMVISRKKSILLSAVFCRPSTFATFNTCTIASIVGRNRFSMKKTVSFVP
jgi:hypothetical protein